MPRQPRVPKASHVLKEAHTTIRISSARLAKLVKTMPNRVRAVIDVGGGHTLQIIRKLSLLVLQLL